MRAHCFILPWLLLGPQIAEAQTQMSSPVGAEDARTIDSRNVQSIALTIYPDNLALVRETRRIDVPAGVVDIQFFGVTDMIIPQSAVLEAFEGLRLEGNFDSDVITPAKLLRKSVGETLTIRRLNPVTGESDLVRAELISAAPEVAPYGHAMMSGQGGTSAVFSTLDGIEGYQCSGLSEAILLSKLPEGLHSVPVLSTRVSAETSGPKDITLTYLTRGLAWDADYRMDVTPNKQPDKQQPDKQQQETQDASLLGWLTLKNETSKSFDDTELSFVAGALNQVKNRDSFNNNIQWDRVATCVLNNQSSTTLDVQVVVQSAPTSGVAYLSGGGGGDDEIIVTGVRSAEVREATQEDLGDYKLYRAPQAVSVKAHQSKQIAFLLKDGIEFETSYSWTLSNIEQRKYSDLDGFIENEIPIPSRVTYEIDNDKDGSLGVSLPRGSLRAMSQSQNGTDIFLGEGSVPNRPVGEPLDVKIADSFLVTARFHDTKEDDENVSAKIDLKNASDREVEVEIDFDLLASVMVRKGRKKLRPKDKTRGLKYGLTLPAEGTVTISFKGITP